MKVLIVMLLLGFSGISQITLSLDEGSGFSVVDHFEYGYLDVEFNGGGFHMNFMDLDDLVFGIFATSYEDLGDRSVRVYDLNSKDTLVISFFVGGEGFINRATILDSSGKELEFVGQIGFAK